MRLVKTAAAALVALLFATLTTAALTSPADASNGEEATYYVTITNETDGQYLTPPNWAAHIEGAHVFQLDAPASPGVTAVAENGGVPVLAAELADALDANGLGDSGVALPTDGSPPPIFPGESRTFMVTSTHDRFSVVAMLICTNDGFAGLDAKALPNKVGQTKQYNLQGYDAGTEINTENDADIVPAPFCNGPEVGSGMSNPALAENGVISRHQGFTGVGDLDPAEYDWTGPVASVVIERVG